MALQRLRQLFSFELCLRLQFVAGISTSSQLLKTSKPKSEAYTFTHEGDIWRKGEFLYGPGPCLAALKANRRKIHAIYMLQDDTRREGAVKALAQKEVLGLADRREVKIRYVDKTVLDSFSENKHHQGLVMDADPLEFEPMELSDCNISETKREESPLWLVLNKVHLPMNVGAIIRSAYFLGVDRIITTTKHSCPLNPIVSKASSGAMEMMPVYALSGCGLELFLSEAKKSGWTVLGIVRSGERLKERGQKRREDLEGGVKEAKAKKLPVIDCHDYRAKGPTIVVLGSEGYGLQIDIGAELRRVCTALLTIAPVVPQESAGSMNIPVAAGIILHTLQNRNQSI